MTRQYKINILKRGDVRPEGNDIFSFNAWPTVGKLKDGTIMVTYSGLRTRHIDPFGTILGCYSRDEGETWTNPVILTNTALDDRDGGLYVLKNGSVFVTSVSNTIAFQRSVADYYDRTKEETAFYNAYLDMLNVEKDEKTLYPKFVYSKDGYVFDKKLYEMPVATPHGPFSDKDDNLYICGTIYENGLQQKDLALYKINKDFTFEKIYHFEGCVNEWNLYEPFGVFLEDGSIVIYFRAQKIEIDDCGKQMKVLKTISHDGGKTFSPIEESGIAGGPPHIMKTSSGLYIFSYGYRNEPFGQMVAISEDGITWSEGFNLDGNSAIFDLGYPSTIELSDNKFMTVYYQTNNKYNKQGIKYTIWEINH